jgi:hypothetical protein
MHDGDSHHTHGRWMRFLDKLVLDKSEVTIYTPTPPRYPGSAPDQVAPSIVLKTWYDTSELMCTVNESLRNPQGFTVTSNLSGNLIYPTLCCKSLLLSCICFYLTYPTPSWFIQHLVYLPHLWGTDMSPDKPYLTVCMSACKLLIW